MSIFSLLLRSGEDEELSAWMYYHLSIVFLYTAQSTLLEGIQMKYTGVAYFKDSWNLVETLQIVLNSILLASILIGNDLKNMIFAIAVLCVTMIKFLIQLRVFEDLGMLVLLIFQCIADTTPFITYLMIWIVFFNSINRQLGVTSGKPISGINVLFSNYINMFRSSVGDIQEPQIVCTNNNCEWITFLNWVIFLLKIYFMTIILNNFLIAKVGSAYEKF